MMKRNAICDRQAESSRGRQRNNEIPPMLSRPVPKTIEISSSDEEKEENEVILINSSDDELDDELQLQETILASLPLTFIRRSTQVHEVSSSLSSSKKKQRIDASESLNHYCGICMDSKTESEMFRNTKVCKHLFCSDCIRSHVSEKIKENIANVKCPSPDCTGLIGPEICTSIVPKEVLERWEDALCESLILGSEKFYCPFKDCSALLVDDGVGCSLTSSECPHCNRLFCVQCKVVWHSGMDCREFKSLKEGEREKEDIMLMNLAKEKKWMRCPKCQFFVEKTEGCPHISCRCGFHFCYRCGQKYHGNHVCASARA